MKDLLKSALLLSAVLCLLSGSWFILQLGRAAQELQNTLRVTSSTLVQIRQDADNLVIMTNATLFQVGDASHAVAVAAREQRKYWNQSGRELVATLATTNRTIADVGRTSQSISQDVRRISDSTVGALDAIAPTLDQSQKTLIAAQQTLEQTRQAVADPSISSSLNELHGSLVEIHATTADIHRKADEMLKPVHWLKRAGIRLLELGISIGTLLK